MAIIPITVFGNKILRQKTRPIKSITDEHIKKIKDMFDTMRNASGIGLAANQVGFTESIFVVDLKGVDGYEKFKPIVMINPEILLESEETEIAEEGCLSLPNIRVEVERPKQIKVKYLDTDENEQELEAEDLFARVILHEYDHLIGKLIPDRVNSEIKKKLKEDLEKIKRKEIKTDYPIAED
ncbi:MAG: peptide deformylase [Melioribacter sp.]|nr:peptide deformylase [Melioribacter sp.]